MFDIAKMAQTADTLMTQAIESNTIPKVTGVLDGAVAIKANVVKITGDLAAITAKIRSLVEEIPTAANVLPVVAVFLEQLAAMLKARQKALHGD
jgi:hypothetical protein